MLSIRSLLITSMLASGCVEAVGETEQTAALDGSSTATDQAAYVAGETIDVTWSGLPGNAKDWVGIAPAGSDPTTVVRWTYVNGATDGNYTFHFLFANGTYVARTFLDDSYTVASQSAPFTVTASSAITPSSPNFTHGQHVVLGWANTPDNARDWIAIAPAGSPITTINNWFYTDGQRGGTRTLNGPSDGAYVARLFMDDSYVLLTETPFTIGGGATVATDRAIYSPNVPIQITWTGLPAMTNDWIGIAPAGAPANQVTAWVYTGAKAGGAVQMRIGTPGTYVARAFPTDTYNIAGESTPFTVGVGCPASATNHLDISKPADVVAAAAFTSAKNVTISPDVANLDVNLPCLESVKVLHVKKGKTNTAVVRLHRLSNVENSLRVTDLVGAFEAPNLVSSGSLTVRDTTLTSLATFSNLRTVSGDVDVDLPSVAGLENLVSIGGNATIRTSTNTSGLAKLATVTGYLDIVAPDVVLPALTSVASLISAGPSSMTRFVAPQLTRVSLELAIRNHAQLPQCYANRLLAQLTSAPQVVTISGLNANGTCQ